MTSLQCRIVILVSLALSFGALPSFAIEPTGPIATSFDDWTFTLAPAGGAVSGAPGDTLSWGYSITNHSTSRWLFAFGQRRSSDIVGTLVTFGPFDYPAIGPGETVTVAVGNPTGFADLIVGDGAGVGVSAGSFVLSGYWYTADPFAIESPGKLVGSAGEQSCPYEVTIVRPPVRFRDSMVPLLGVSASSVAWADCDNDGDLDVLVAGLSEVGPVSKLYISSGGTEPTFSDSGIAFVGVSHSSVAWGDYDNDGYVDVLLTGMSATGPTTRLYENTTSGAIVAFAEVSATLLAVSNSSVAWGDYDNDGDLDLLLTGLSASGAASRLYQNDGAENPSLRDSGCSIVGVFDSSVAWGDWNNDGYLDIVVSGMRSGGRPVTAFYANRSGSSATAFDAYLIFLEVSAVSASSVALGDCDSDGDLDVLLTGLSAVGPVTDVYFNSGAKPNPYFSDSNASLMGVSNGCAAWADFDNDGDLDIAVAGAAVSGNTARVYRNDNGIFVEIVADLPGIGECGLAWGDYDGDGDVDLLVAGQAETEAIARLYRVSGALRNAVPEQPSGLQVESIGSVHTFSWSGVTDAQTPELGLSYNLRIGTTPRGNDIISGMADEDTGLRRIVRRGALQGRTSLTMRLPAGTYYWSVQALDGAFAGSPFAVEQQFDYRGYRDAGASLWDGNDSSDVAWGDYDDDGDLDLVVIGDQHGPEGPFRIYQNQGGSFFEVSVGLPISGGNDSKVEWGDYDSDSDLDLLVVGEILGSAAARIYRNDGGVFADIGAGLLGLASGVGAWGDYDNDGDLDIVLGGSTNGTISGDILRVYRNDNGTFVDMGASVFDVIGVHAHSVDWGDYDRDGDLDLLIAGGYYVGNYNSFIPATWVFMNIDRAFHNSGARFETTYGYGRISGRAVWGDYDNDGDLDVVIAGSDEGYSSRIYQNLNGTYVAVASLPFVTDDHVQVEWLDYDGDGDLDLWLSGEDGINPVGGIFLNDDGRFVLVDCGLPLCGNAVCASGDYDHDGRIDIVIGGYSLAERAWIARVYRNEGGLANTPPNMLGGLKATMQGGNIALSWGGGSDSQTLGVALSYNLRIGVTPGGCEISSPMADPASGYRRLPAVGRILVMSHEVTMPPGDGPLYWSVQAVDASFAGGPFAPEQRFSRAAAGADLPGVPATTSLVPSVPNPFNPSTTIGYTLAHAERVRLAIYDIGGRLVRVLVDEARPTGRHVTQWDGKNSRGRQMASGVYFYRMEAGAFTDTKRMTLIK